LHMTLAQKFFFNRVWRIPLTVYYLMSNKQYFSYIQDKNKFNDISKYP
jgi:hypothetical protein